MKHTLTFFLLFISIPFFAWAKNPQVNKIAVETKDQILKDTIYVIKEISDGETIKSYQEILEKTNSQLSLWWNPYGVLIAFLGVLFTALTIIAAIVIYRQSREHKELIKESIIKHENVLGKMITERNQQLKIIESNLDNTINEYREKLKSATEENKQEIKKLIQTLEAQKESIDSQIQSTYVNPQDHSPVSLGMAVYGITPPPHRCSSCGYGYIVKPGAIYPSFSNRSRSITCPKCGNVESYTSPF
jgi:hypothetical protein